MSIGPAGENLIFIISRPRVGSTLLQRMLGCHEQIHTTTEPWIMLHPAYQLRPNGYDADYGARVTRNGVRHFLEQLPDGENEYYRAVGKMCRYLYNRALESSGKQMFLDKTPRYYHVVPELQRIFPNAFYIVLERNPLATLGSIISSRLRFHDWYRLERHRFDLFDGLEQMAHLLDHLPPNAVDVRFENLLTEPEVQLERITRTLGVAYDPRMVEYGDQPLPNWAFGDHKTLYKKDRPDAAHLDRWIDAMDDPQAWRLARDYLDALDPGLLQRLGYDHRELKTKIDSVRPGRMAVACTVSLKALIAKKEIDRTVVERRAMNRWRWWQRAFLSVENRGPLAAMKSGLRLIRGLVIKSRAVRKTTAARSNGPT